MMVGHVEKMKVKVGKVGMGLEREQPDQGMALLRPMKLGPYQLNHRYSYYLMSELILLEAASCRISTLAYEG